MANRRRNCFIVITCCIICCAAWSLFAQDLDYLVANSLDFAQQQLEYTVDVVGSSNKFPRSTLSDGSWDTRDSGSWTSGFFPGCLWFMYEWTDYDTWKEWAESWTAGMESEKNNKGTHDVGFLIFCSFGNGYRITKNEAYPDVIIQAVRSLATRYNPTVGLIKSQNRGTFYVIIDNMMNLELLFWASKNGGESNLYDIAASHALNTIKYLVREDGSTYQNVDLVPTTGYILSRGSGQGYAEETTWARGQAWALYGFTMTYRETGDTLFLNTAQKIADYFIENLPDDHVPYWDFQAPDIPNEEKESSAAAIAASGLLQLSTFVSGAEAKAKYRNAAFDILTSLCSSPYLAEGSNSYGILLHSNGNINKNSEVDVSMIYADYYFIEALLRYQNISTSVEDQHEIVPSSIQVLKNYPNPFNPVTTILYRLQSSTNVTLGVYNLNGQLIQTLYEGFQEKGDHEFYYHAENISTGTYILLLRAGTESLTRKFTLIK